MATRRTVSEVKDLVGRTIRPGDVIAVAVSSAYGASSASQNLVLVENIYLDDSKGLPYQEGWQFYYRDSNGVVRDGPSDGQAVYGHQRTPEIVPVTSEDEFTPSKIKKPYVGSDYAGVDEIVVRQSHRLVGRQIDTNGELIADGRLSTYENIRAVRILTPDELEALRRGTLEGSSRS